MDFFIWNFVVDNFILNLFLAFPNELRCLNTSNAICDCESPTQCYQNAMAFRAAYAYRNDIDKGRLKDLIVPPKLTIRHNYCRTHSHGCAAISAKHRVCFFFNFIKKKY